MIDKLQNLDSSAYEMKDEPQKAEDYSFNSEIVCERCDNSFGNEHDLDLHIQSVHIGMWNDEEESDEDEMELKLGEEVRDLSVNEAASRVGDKADTIGSTPSSKQVNEKSSEGKVIKEEPIGCVDGFKTEDPVANMKKDRVKKKAGRKKTDEKERKCELCGGEFKFPAQVKTHLISYHSQEKKFECYICLKRFGQEQNLLNHLRKHHPDKPIQVKRVNEQDAVVEDPQVPKGKYRCEECGKFMQSKAYLEFHIRSVHLKIRAFECDQCDRSFTTKGILYTHIRIIHLKTFPFPCKNCNKGYVSRSALRSHFLSAHAERPFKCELCSSSYRVKEEMEMHIQGRKHQFKLAKQNGVKAGNMKKEDPMMIHASSLIWPSRFACAQMWKLNTELVDMPDESVIVQQ